MREAWAQLCHGGSLILDAVATMIQGASAAAPGGVPEARAGSPSPAGASPAAPAGDAPHDPIRALIEAVLQRAAAGGGTTAGEVTTQAPDDSGNVLLVPDHTPGADAHVLAHTTDDREAPMAAEVTPEHVPLVAQPCQELERQAREKGRRATLAKDPLNALEVGTYYTKYLRTQPQRAEEWVRCLEAIPGAAPDRLRAAFAQGGIPGWQTYAQLWDEARHDLEEAKRVTGAFRTQHPEQAGEWLDADREGRVWLWLGDRPDVEAPTTSLMPPLPPWPDDAPPEAGEAPAAFERAAAPASEGSPHGFKRTLRPDDGAPLRIRPLFPPPVAPEDGPFEEPLETISAPGQVVPGVHRSPVS